MPYSNLEYKQFRVRTPIKTFRDLDVYKNTTQLAADVFSLKLPEKYRKSEKIKRLNPQKLNRKEKTKLN